MTGLADVKGGRKKERHGKCRDVEVFFYDSHFYGYILLSHK